MTRDEAKALYDSGWWKALNYYDRVKFQLFEDRLCMPFGVYHEAVEKSLGRSVWTHEFAWSENLRREFLGDMPAPSMQEIMSLIPADKRIMVIGAGRDNNPSPC